MVNEPSAVQETLIDAAIKDAQDLPDLIKRFEGIDPNLATQLGGKALIASKTPWGVLVSGIVGWLVGHYALGFDATTTNLVAGAFVLVGSFAMRYITRAPITSIVSKATV